MRAFGLALMFAGALMADPAPLLVYLAPAAAQSVPSVADYGWELEVVRDVPASDAGVKAIEAAIEAARKRRSIDPLRVYLAGAGEGASAAFYAVSRRPDLWAAAVAFGGSPKPAIESNRLFVANSQLVPFLWVARPDDKALEGPRSRLAAVGFPVTARSSGDVTADQAFAWLAEHKRDAFPEMVDCETGNLAFARCYWIELTRFDPTQRNDLLPVSRVSPGSGAALALGGGFGIALDDAGPGALVTWLHPTYKGPLKVDDRIVLVGAKAVADGRDYMELMERLDEEKLTAIIVQRGKQRVRVETKIVLARREETKTARFQAHFVSDYRELLLITRGAGAVRLTIPPQWTPCPVNWNGTDAGTVDAQGCWAIETGGKAHRCE